MTEYELGFPEHLEVTNLYPHEPIAKDMAIDMLGVAERETRFPRRVRKRIQIDKNFYIKYGQGVGTTFAPGQDEYEKDLGSPELFSDMHADEMRKRVIIGARYIGGMTMSRVIQFMPSYVPLRYEYNPTVCMNDEKMSVVEWAEEVWAPDYTERFVAAATMFDAQEIEQ